MSGFNTGLSIIVFLAIVGGILSWLNTIIENREPSDYIIEQVEIDGMECVLIREFSQIGITCDWSK